MRNHRSIATIAAPQCQYCGADITPAGQCPACAGHAADELANARVALEAARHQLEYTEQQLWRIGAAPDALGAMLDGLTAMIARVDQLAATKE